MNETQALREAVAESLQRIAEDSAAVADELTDDTLSAGQTEAQRLRGLSERLDEWIANTRSYIDTDVSGTSYLLRAQADLFDLQQSGGQA